MPFHHFCFEVVCKKGDCVDTKPRGIEATCTVSGDRAPSARNKNLGGGQLVILCVCDYEPELNNKLTNRYSIWGIT